MCYLFQGFPTIAEIIVIALIGGVSWEEASNVTKLLAIYSHPKYKQAVALDNTSTIEVFTTLFSFDDYIFDDSVVGNFFDWVKDNSVIGSLFG